IERSTIKQICHYSSRSRCVECRSVSTKLIIAQQEWQADGAVAHVINRNHVTRPQLMLEADVELQRIRNLEIARKDSAESVTTRNLEKCFPLARIELMVRVSGVQSQMHFTDRRQNVLDRLTDQVAVIAIGMFAIHIDRCAIWPENTALVERVRSDAGWNDGELVEDRVVGDIHFVGEIETATNRGLASAKWIPREAETRAEFVFRELRRVKRWWMNQAENRRATRAVFFLLVKESSVVFPTRPEVDRQVASSAPVVAHVPGKTVIVVSAVRKIMRCRNSEEAIGRAGREIPEWI